ncbi:NUDIX hydrolase [Mesobaculum littorinae]|uniref:NUDIX hydrolase n=1 Tax=Mesobaculum littorinae TaxID=2486419 RepID=A0A438AJZ2_9RHOB|nr:NUDIX hydrolase [Mesobaculum littorinae]RVV98969.1 NUDIX hydrolase [Mesobaculum littorinae]
MSLSRFLSRLPRRPAPVGPEPQQYGALCWRRRKGRVQVLLVTTRRTGRWTPPKGWPMSGRAPHDAARQEAWEEAGVIGRARPDPVGHYSYIKHSPVRGARRFRVDLFALRVERLKAEFPEAATRERRWFDLSDAAAAVEEPGLREILRDFVPPRGDGAGNA